MTSSQQEVVSALERYPATWRLTGRRPLTGDVAVTFTPSGDEPAAGAAWVTAVWVTDDPDEAVREVQVMLAGSAAKQLGDAHPGTGFFTAHLRYVEGQATRIIPGGLIGFR